MLIIDISLNYGYIFRILQKKWGYVLIFTHIVIYNLILDTIEKVTFFTGNKPAVLVFVTPPLDWKKKLYNLIFFIKYVVHK